MLATADSRRLTVHGRGTYRASLRSFTDGRDVPWCIDRATRQPNRDRRCPVLTLGSLAVPRRSASNTGVSAGPLRASLGVIAARDVSASAGRGPACPPDDPIRARIAIIRIVQGRPLERRSCPCKEATLERLDEGCLPGRAGLDGDGSRAGRRHQSRRSRAALLVVDDDPAPSA